MFVTAQFLQLTPCWWVLNKIGTQLSGSKDNEPDWSYSGPEDTVQESQFLIPSTLDFSVSGVIPVTASELKAVNIPAFHITSLNIMLSPTSIAAAAPVLSNSCLNSCNTSSAQNPNSSVLNFTLQHVGLIPAGMQVPANPVLQHVPISPKAENSNHSSENMNLQEEKVSKNITTSLTTCPVGNNCSNSFLQVNFLNQYFFNLDL